MKHLCILFAVFLLFACQKETLLEDQELTRRFTIASAETKRSYDISVQLPENDHKSTHRYSTLYVLDANQDERFVAKTCKTVSKNLNTPNVIVIGIRYQQYSDRDIDYTPTATTYGQGKSAEFLTFIKNKLIPRIQAEYRADTLRDKRVLIGHSFGGLCGAFAFTNYNEVFGNYLLLSPSLFYDNSVLLTYEQQARPALQAKPHLVFIGLGSTEGSLLPANDVLYRRLVKFYPNTKSKFQLVPGRGHVTSKNSSIENAIHFYFKNR